MELLFFWVVMAVITAMVASSRGRSGFGFFLYGLLLWPIALTQALLSKPKATARPLPQRSNVQVDSGPHYPPAEAFMPHGMVGGRPFRQNPDGSATVLAEGREVVFPSRVKAVQAFGELRVHEAWPPVEEDFDADEDADVVHERGRAYPSFVAGLAHSVRHKGANRSRARYAFAMVHAGDPLLLLREPDNPDDARAVAVHHQGFPLGYVPKRHRWVADSIEGGDRITASVTTIAPSRANPDVPFIGILLRVSDR